MPRDWSTGWVRWRTRVRPRNRPVERTLVDSLRNIGSRNKRLTVDKTCVIIFYESRFRILPETVFTYIYLVYGHVRCAENSDFQNPHLKESVEIFGRQNGDVPDQRAQNPETDAQPEVIFHFLFGQNARVYGYIRQKKKILFVEDVLIWTLYIYIQIEILRIPYTPLSSLLPFSWWRLLLYLLSSTSPVAREIKQYKKIPRGITDSRDILDQTKQINPFDVIYLVIMSTYLVYGFQK